MSDFIWFIMISVLFVLLGLVFIWLGWQIRKKQRIRENSLSGTILNIKTPPRQGVFEKFDKK